MRVPLLGGFASGISSDINAETCVNMFPEAATNGRSSGVLRKIPGLSLLGSGTQTSNNIRTILEFEESGTRRVYIVNGNRFQYWDGTAFQNSAMATFTTTDGVVTWAIGDDDVVFADGTNSGRSLSTAGASSNVTFPSSAKPTHIINLDSYYIINDLGSSIFHVSDPNDPNTWSTGSATAERDPDSIDAIEKLNRELWLFGRNTTEVWWNSGNADFPFEPIQGAFSEYGILARYTAVRVGESIIWLARNRNGYGTVRRTNGYDSEKISTVELDYTINSMTNPQDARAFSYEYDGHQFYILSFPSEGKTFVFDTTTGLWHQRSSFDTEGNWRVNCAAFFEGNQHTQRGFYLGDLDSNEVYYLDRDTYSDNGNPILCERTMQYVHAEGKTVFCKHFVLELEEGVGNANITDPQVTLSWSDDGGHTWSNEHSRSAGKVGEYNKKIIWRRLGNFKDRIFRVKFGAEAKFIIIDAYIDIDLSDREY